MADNENPRRAAKPVGGGNRLRVTDGESATGGPPTNRGRRLPPEPLTPGEVRQLLAASSNRYPSGIRLRAMIGVMYGAGLRLAETLDLYPRDVDTAKGTVRVAVGKGGKYRTVGIDPYSCALVDRWIDRRAKLGLNGRSPLFSTYERGEMRQNFGQRLSPRYVRAALARLGRKAGLDKRVHPHGLRHSLASDMADRGFNTHDIQAQLGHGSLATTDRYIRRLRPTGLIEAMRERDWSE